MSTSSLPARTDELPLEMRLSGVFPDAVGLNQAIQTRQTAIDEYRALLTSPLDIPETVATTAMAMTATWVTLVNRGEINPEEIRQYLPEEIPVPRLLSDIVEEAMSGREAKNRMRQVADLVHDDKHDFACETEPDRIKRVTALGDAVASATSSDSQTAREVWAQVSGPQLVRTVCQKLQAGKKPWEIIAEQPDIVPQLEEYRYTVGFSYLVASTQEPIPDIEDLTAQRQQQEEYCRSHQLSLAFQHIEAPFAFMAEHGLRVPSKELAKELGREFTNVVAYVQALETVNLQFGLGELPTDIEKLAAVGPEIVEDLIIALTDTAVDEHAIRKNFETFLEWLSITESICKESIDRHGISVELVKNDRNRTIGYRLLE